MSHLYLISPRSLAFNGMEYGCTIGRGGIAAPGEKREGDLKTPAGTFSLRRCYYRPDRMPAPQTGLPVTPLTPASGWCDDAQSPTYNRPVSLPYRARHEILWREDSVYDLIIPLGYNDDPVIPGAGSAIFMHLMRPDGVGTEGCVAVSRKDLLAMLPHFTTDTKIIIK